jgi:hypothetical protein
MKILPVEVELFHALRWTDMTKLLVAFHNFANARKNLSQITGRVPGGLVCIATRLRAGQTGEEFPIGGDFFHLKKFRPSLGSN